MWSLVMLVHITIEGTHHCYDDIGTDVCVLTAKLYGLVTYIQNLNINEYNLIIN